MLYIVCEDLLLKITASLQALKCVLLYLILAPFDNEQSDLIHRVKEDKYLENIPLYQ